MDRGARIKRETVQEVRDLKMKLKQKARSKEWRWSMILLSFIIVGYFISSLALTFFQKSLISHMRYPISIVLCHLVLKFGFASIARQVLTNCNGQRRVVLSWSDYMSRVALVAIFSALDIGLSQWSFEFITVSLYTMTKTTAVLFILFFALLFRLEKMHWSLIIIVLMISMGLFLFVYQSTTFHFLGFCMALGAAFLSGARWSLSQLIMQKSKLGLENPVDLIYHIQPIMVLTLLPFAAGFEGIRLATSEHAFRFHSYDVLFTTIGLVSFGGTIAFAMEVFEFFIVTKASSLTLSIVGICKEIVTILLDVTFNGSQLSLVNVIGVIICLTGIALHILRKAASPNTDLNLPRSTRRNRRGFRDRGIKETTSLPLLDEDSDFSTDEDELFNPGGIAGKMRARTGASHDFSGNSKYKDFDENFFLRDNRQWTSVRDSHLRMSMESGMDRLVGDPPSVLKDEKNSPTQKGNDAPVFPLADLESD